MSRGRRACKKGRGFSSGREKKSLSSLFFVVESAVRQDKMATVDELRTAGNDLYKAGKYVEAEAKYTAALELEPSNHLILSNRSLARCSEKKYDAAIEDARECLKVGPPDFVKGYYRLANAQLGLGLVDEALASVKKGLAIEEDNVELKKLTRIIKAKKTKGEKKPTTTTKTESGGGSSRLTAEKQREIADLAQTLRSHEKEKNQVAIRTQMCRREIARSQLTSTEIADLPDESPVYRAVGKIFLESSKAAVLDALHTEKSNAEQRASSLTARATFLDREIQSKEAELKAIAG